MPEVLSERDGHVQTLTLNRPDRMNSIGGKLLTELTAELQSANADRDVRAIILTGAGRGFCSGLDLQDAAANDGNPSDGAQSTVIADTPPFLMRRIDKPILCAMNGPAAGYGMDLALGCDLLLVSDQASFIPPVRRGAVPESGGTWLLPRLIGWQKAAEVTLLARKLDAKEIERLGLANAVVPHAHLIEEANRWANELASNAPLAMQAAKRSMRAGLDSSFETNAHQVLAEVMNLFHTKDFAEGVAAFMEKREPKYRGR